MIILLLVWLVLVLLSICVHRSLVLSGFMNQSTHTVLQIEKYFEFYWQTKGRCNSTHHLLHIDFISTRKNGNAQKILSDCAQYRVPLSLSFPFFLSFSFSMSACICWTELYYWKSCKLNRR